MPKHYKEIADPDIELLESIAHKLGVDINLTHTSIIEKVFSLTTSTLGITSDKNSEHIEIVMLQAISDQVDASDPSGINPKYTAELLKYMESRGIIDLDSTDKSSSKARGSKSEYRPFEIANTIFKQLGSLTD